MILKHARVARNAIEARHCTLSIQGRRLSLAAHRGCGPEVDLSGFLILPGLINAHDHLEFNLFPRLGRGPYPNATAWAEDIYRPYEHPVREQLQIPKPLRLIWGGIKNLISGVTSVFHHNPYDAPVFQQNFPVRVIRRFGWAHSLRYGGDIAQAWSRTPPGSPFVIHACEGTDAQSSAEIHRLDAAGMLGPKTVVVHGVALDEAGIGLVTQRGASLVWCPTSNYFTLGRTISTEVLHSRIPIALGTDSALTSRGDLLDEIEVAARETDRERVYGMVTEVAAKILRLQGGEGRICEGGIADLVVVPDRGQSPAAALCGLRPELVLVGGRIKLMSAGFARRLAPILSRRLQPLEIKGRGQWLIDCDVTTLLQTVKAILGEDFRLAGRGVAA
jgi:cytosine/adenosine deaminase-related metal-dependent hydrolase